MSCSGQQRNHDSLHQSALVVDMHCDGVLKMKKGLDFSVRNETDHMDVPRLKEGGTDLQVFACWLDTKTPVDECRQTVDELIDTLESVINRNSADMGICLSAAQAESIIADGKIAAFVGIENGVALANDLDNVQHFYDRGVRYITLTHTASSDWCISSADTAPAFHGLTDFGRDVVSKMNELGMIIDVSHASVSAFEEVMKVTTSPIIASHSCAYALCKHNRNLTDEQIKAIAENGGVIGVNYYNGYISENFNHMMDSLWDSRKAEMDSLDDYFYSNDSLRKAAIKPIWEEIKAELDTVTVTLSDVIDHIDYIVKLVGPDYVGLGSDWDGVFIMPKGLEDCSKVPDITKELVARGYSDEDIRKILGGNFMRVFRQVCGEGA